MDLNEFQNQALKSAQYPNRGSNLVYPTLGLAGETGEFVEQVKKWQRGDDPHDVDPYDIHKPNSSRKLAMMLELGDVLWYCAAIASELGYSLSTVANANLLKVERRIAEGTIKGSGSDR